MDTGLISGRYAKALLEYTVKNGEADRVYDEISRMVEYFRESHQLRDVLNSPVLSVKQKALLLRTVFPGKYSHSLKNFVVMVMRHHREHLLYFMFTYYVEIYKIRQGLKDATLVTAGPVSEEFITSLRRQVEESRHCKVDLCHKVDPDIIGGFIFRMDDHVVDASVASQLNLLRRSLGAEPEKKF